MRRTDTLILADAMDILAREIQSDDGVANAAIAEAASRLRELYRALYGDYGPLRPAGKPLAAKMRDGEIY